MFGSIGWGEVFVLLVAGLVILGPERLPGAITWATDSLRKVRSYAQNASGQLREQLGPELSDLQEPLQQLSKLRRTSPSALLSQHLLDGQSLDSMFNPLSRSSSSDTTPPTKPSTVSGTATTPPHSPSVRGDSDQHTPTYDRDAT